VAGGQACERAFAGGAVDVEHVEPVPGGQADVGLGEALPPPLDLLAVGGGVVEAVGGDGVLADRAAARVAAGAGDLAAVPNGVVDR
jgi:hypothetical protein